MPEGEGSAAGLMLASFSNAMVRLHREQFGRGPVQARSGWNDNNTLVTTLHDALLPAERALVDMGQVERVQEARLHFQEATRDRFIGIAQEIVGREVKAFASACDPRTQMVWEIFTFRP